MTPKKSNRRQKTGRPTIRKSGIPFTDAELSRRYRKRQKAKQARSNCEWYTPKWFVEAVRRVFGGAIDLDPATCVLANSVVRAKRYFTFTDDGLKQEWFGKLYLNPPYNKGVLRQFITKMLAEIAAGHVTEAIMLTHARTDTVWFQKLVKSGAVVAFPKRVNFWSVEKNAPKDGSVAHDAAKYRFLFWSECQTLPFSVRQTRTGFLRINDARKLSWRASKCKGSTISLQR